MIKFTQRYLIKIVPIYKELIEKYKSSNNLLMHVDPNDVGYMIIDKIQNNLIGYVAWDNNIITALEVIKEYQGKGYSKILLKIAEENNCNELTVDKNNKKAISIYEHLGWKFYRSLGPKMLIYRKYNF